MKGQRTDKAAHRQVAPQHPSVMAIAGTIGDVGPGLNTDLLPAYPVPDQDEPEPQAREETVCPSFAPVIGRYAQHMAQHIMGGAGIGGIFQRGVDHGEGAILYCFYRAQDRRT